MNTVSTSGPTAGGWWPKVRLLVSVGLLVLVLSRLDLVRAVEILSSAHLGLIGLAILLGFAGRFFAALRWLILLRAMNSDAPYLDLVRLSFIGMFLGFLPAGTIALEAGRIYGLSRTTDDLAGSFASVLLERLFGLGALIVVALVGLTFAPPGVPPLLGGLAWVGLAMVLAVAFGMMSRLVRKAIARLLVTIRLKAIQNRLEKVFTRLDELHSSSALLGLSAVVALVNTLFRILPAWLVALALGVDVTLVQLLIILPLIYLVGQIPISVGGLGVREVGWVALLGVIGVPASESIVLALLLVAIVFVVSLPGAWLYARHGFEEPGGAPPDVTPRASRRA